MELVADLVVETAVSKLIKELTDFGCRTVWYKKYWDELQDFLQTMGPIVNGLIDVLRNSGQGSGRFKPIFEALQESLQEAKGFKQRGRTWIGPLATTLEDVEKHGTDSSTD